MMNAYVQFEEPRRRANGKCQASHGPQKTPDQPGTAFGSSMPGMKILSVTSEIFPLIKTGGLADVTGSLPKALEPLGVETTTIVPGYPKVMQQLKSAMPLLVFDDLLGERASLLHTRIEGLSLFVLDAPVPCSTGRAAPMWTLPARITPTTGSASAVLSHGRGRDRARRPARLGPGSRPYP